MAQNWHPHIWVPLVMANPHLQIWKIGKRRKKVIKGRFAFRRNSSKLAICFEYNQEVYVYMSKFYVILYIINAAIKITLSEWKIRGKSQSCVHIMFFICEFGLRKTFTLSCIERKKNCFFAMEIYLLQYLESYDQHSSTKRNRWK